MSRTSAHRVRGIRLWALLLPVAAAVAAYFAASGPRWSQNAGRYGVVRERMFSKDSRRLFTVHAPPVHDDVDAAIPYTLVRWDVASGKVMDAKLLSKVEGRVVNRWVGFGMLPDVDRILAVEGNHSPARSIMTYRYAVHDPYSGECIHGPVRIASYLHPSYWSRDRRWYMLIPPKREEVRVVDAAVDLDVVRLRLKREQAADVEVVPVSPKFSADGKSIAVLWGFFEKSTREAQRLLLRVYDLPSGRLRDELGLERKWSAIESWSDDGWISLIASEPDPQREGATFRRSYRFNLAAKDLSNVPPDPLREGYTTPVLADPTHRRMLHPKVMIDEEHGWIMRHHVSSRKENTVENAWLKRLGDRLNVDLLRYLPERYYRTNVYDANTGRLTWQLPGSEHRWHLSPDGRYASPYDESVQVDVYSSDQTPPWLAALAAGIATASVLAFVSATAVFKAMKPAPTMVVADASAAHARHDA